MTDRRPTIRDVAEVAGVSAMSVSRVLNGRPGVGAETASRIEEVIRTLGYRPNMLATTLRQQRRLSLIGMIVPDPYTPLFTSIAVAVDDLVREEGLIVVTASSDGNVAQERDLVVSFIERGVDGILLFTEDRDHSYLEAEVERGFPLVFLGTPPNGLTCPTVLVDNRAGARVAVEHLYGHGHRRIGIVTNTNRFPASERLAGFQDAANEHGIDVDPSLIFDEAHGSEPGRRAIEAIARASDPPTALFSTNYLLTAEVLATQREHPTPIGLVAFDDFEAALLVDPPITVVTQDPPAMAAHAARMLIDQMEGGSDRDTVVVPPRLVPRGSGELRPASPSPALGT